MLQLWGPKSAWWEGWQLRYINTWSMDLSVRSFHVQPIDPAEDFQKKILLGMHVATNDRLTWDAWVFKAGIYGDSRSGLMTGDSEQVEDIIETRTLISVLRQSPWPSTLRDARLKTMFPQMGDKSPRFVNIHQTRLLTTNAESAAEVSRGDRNAMNVGCYQPNVAVRSRHPSLSRSGSE